MATNPARKPLVVKPASHFLLVLYAQNIAVNPAAHAARVVLVATRPMPSKSIADSVLPGLKPYQPNHRISPPETAIVKSCGSMGAPPSRLNVRPKRGPRTMEPARAMNPPMVCTTVDPAKSWKPMPNPGQKCPSLPIAASQPSGPQAQWPMMGEMKPETATL